MGVRAESEQATRGACRLEALRRQISLSLLAALLSACVAPTREDPTPAAVRQAPSETSRTRPLGVGAIEGEVVGPAGKPVAGALVSACGKFEPQLPDPGHAVVSDADGYFRFSALPPGRYGLTATASGAAGGYAGVVVVPSVGESSQRVVIKLGSSGATYRGVVRDETGVPLSGARVLAAAFSENEAETYVARTDGQGRYVLEVPPTQRYMLAADAAPRVRASQPVSPTSQTVHFTLDPLPAPRPPDEAIRAWLKEAATPLSSAPELDAPGASAFSAIVGDASIVALGEATHGSGEFPEWRRRVFQALVRDKGFTVYAVEAPWAEAQVLDDYVVNGRGDAREAIRALRTWKDETEETLRLVHWMRSYNADPRHVEKVHFEGFDVFTPHAVALLRRYLSRVDAAALRMFEPFLVPFAGLDSDQTYPALATSEQERLRRGLTELVTRMDQNRARYAASTSESEWERARQCARVIEQASFSYPNYAARDEQMFENFQWLVEHYPRGTKFVLDAHNNHIAAERHDVAYTGQLMRQHWGARYVAIGFAFSEGSLYALDWTGGDPNVRRVFHVDRAPVGTFDHDLSLGGMARFVIDLRKAEGPIAAWLHSYQRMRSIGGGFSGPDDFEVFTPARAFDAIIYLDQVSAIHPLAAMSE